MSGPVKTRPQSAQSGSIFFNDEDDAPTQGSAPWVWFPRDTGTGDWTGDTTVYYPDVPAAPANTVAPAITGTATTGSTLTCSTGTWTGSPTPTYTRQWKRDGASISGETASTYLLDVADEGTDITCTVTATNTQGSASAASNTVNPTAAESFDPTDYGTVLANWIGDDAPGADAAAMAVWDDSSAAGRDMAQSTSGSRPVKHTNVVNSHAAVRFDGVDDLMTFTQMSTIRSLFIVARWTGAFDQAGSIIGGVDTFDFLGIGDAHVLDFSFAATAVKSGSTWANGVSVATNSLVKVADTFVLFEFVTFGNATADQLGQDRTNAGSGSWRGDFAEILAYSDALDSTARQAVEAHLMTKYGLS